MGRNLWRRPGEVVAQVLPNGLLFVTKRGRQLPKYQGPVVDALPRLLTAFWQGQDGLDQVGRLTIEKPTHLVAETSDLCPPTPLGFLWRCRRPHRKPLP